MNIYIKACFRGNPRGAGEAAAIIEYIDKTGKCHIREKQFQIEQDTKNALYLKTSITAIRILLKPCRITIYMDCDYIANACRLGWLDKWHQGGWKKANGKPPANMEDWKQFYMLTEIHAITFAAYDNKYEKELMKALEGRLAEGA